jgi:putative transcriptional regulator
MGHTTNRLAELMRARGMSLSDLQRRTGMSYSSLFAFYHKRTTRSDFETLARLCEALNVGIGDLLEYVPDERRVEDVRA